MLRCLLIVLFAGGTNHLDPAAAPPAVTPDILAALTTNPAEQLGAAKRLGRVAPGYEADLVILGDDPTRDLGALTDVRYTLRAGAIIYRSAR